MKSHCSVNSALVAGIMVWFVGCSPKPEPPPLEFVKPKPIDLTPDSIDVSRFSIQAEDRSLLHKYRGPTQAVLPLRLRDYIKHGPDLQEYKQFVDSSLPKDSIVRPLYDSMLYVAWSETAEKRKTAALHKVLERTGEFLVSQPERPEIQTESFLILAISHEQLAGRMPKLKDFHSQSALRYYAGAFNERVVATDPWWRAMIGGEIVRIVPDEQQILTLQQTSNKYAALFQQFGQYKYAAMWAQNSFDLCLLRESKCDMALRDQLNKTMIKMWQFHIAKVKKGKAGLTAGYHKAREIGRAYLALYDRLKLFQKGTSEFYLRQAQRHYQNMLSANTDEINPAWKAEAQYALRAR